MKIRRAVPSDAAALAEIAERTFRDAFAAQNKPEDVEVYCAQAYSEALQRVEIENPDGVTLLGEEEGVLIAYTQLRRAPTEHGDVEILRFYVDQKHHGNGFAQALMQAAGETARALGGTVIWLGVWEHNPRAIAFYSKCGFRDAGSHPFLVGSDLQTDRIMVCVISGA